LEHYNFGSRKERKVKEKEGKESRIQAASAGILVGNLLNV